jgi:hypothetical protein
MITLTLTWNMSQRPLVVFRLESKVVLHKHGNRRLGPLDVHAHFVDVIQQHQKLFLWVCVRTQGQQWFQAAAKKRFALGRGGTFTPGENIDTYDLHAWKTRHVISHGIWRQ